MSFESLFIYIMYVSHMIHDQNHELNKSLAQIESKTHLEHLQPSTQTSEHNIRYIDQLSNMTPYGHSNIFFEFGPRRHT